MSNITATPLTVRSHLMVAEMEDSDYGYRTWSDPMLPFTLDLWVRGMEKVGYGLSDYCCAASCWCAAE